MTNRRNIDRFIHKNLITPSAKRVQPLYSAKRSMLSINMTFTTLCTKKNNILDCIVTCNKGSTCPPVVMEEKLEYREKPGKDNDRGGRGSPVGVFWEAAVSKKGMRPGPEEGNIPVSGFRFCSKHSFGLLKLSVEAVVNEINLFSTRLD